MNYDQQSQELYEKMQACQTQFNKIVLTRIIEVKSGAIGLLLTKALWYKIRIFELKYVNGFQVITEKSKQYMSEKNANKKLEKLDKKYNNLK